ncbi:HET domain protein [Akanthomyces lecanii RCEF 1005]|uniref:HET domain protein n=1 Tax=Akanthomyces lecanii RCEF 1005 TaxID=1081108 RepID=A0A162LFT6_CORDF|nr:HET domain protein [Akanthomyces lecanii RCEF 1005]
MDLLCQPGDPIDSLPETPYICQVESQGQVFRTYPSQQGKADWFPTAHAELGVPPPSSHRGQINPMEDASAPSFLQTWLYFGILSEFLGLNQTNPGGALLSDEQRLAEIKTLHQEFTIVKGGRRLLTGRPILQKLELISQRVRQAPDLPARLHHLAFCLRIAAWALNSVQLEIPLPIQYSISALCEVLYSVILLMAALSKPSINLAAHSFSLGYIKPGGEIENKMLLNGWCLSDMDTLKKPQLGFHGNCTAQDCKALQTNLRSYTPRHTVDSCPCSSIGTDLAKIAATLKDSKYYPILQIKHGGSCLDDLQVDVIPYVPGMQYIALSHVWADGLGNPRVMALPRCQLRYLADITESLSRRTDHHLEDVFLFWIDTLCCPVENTLKTIALERIADVYCNAAHVLVLDWSLAQFSANTHPAELLLRTFGASRWMRRLWTLQEAALAQNLWVQYQDGVAPVAELLATLRDVGWREDIRLLRIFMDVSRESLQRLLHFRSVSVPSDEPLCIATLMRLKITPELTKSTDLDLRMKVVWQALSQAAGGISPQILLYLDKGIDVDGWRWAPQSFLSSSTAKSSFTLEEKAARFAEPYETDGGPYTGQITPLGLRVQMNGCRIRAPPHSPCCKLHPWGDLGYEWNAMFYLHDAANDKWYRVTDFERGARMPKMTKEELAGYDKQNSTCERLHTGNCVLLYGSLRDSGPTVCCLGQVVDHTMLDPDLLSKVTDPDNILFVRRNRSAVLSDNVGPDETKLLNVLLRLAKEAAAHPVTAALSRMGERQIGAGREYEDVLDDARHLFKQLVKSACDEYPDLRRTMLSVFGKALGDQIWALPALLFSHDLLMEKLPPNQVLEESDYIFLKDVAEMTMDFQKNLLDGDNEFNIPPVFVNREARGIALSWLDEEGIKVEQPRPGRYVFRCPFGCTSDTMYVPDDKWDDFNEGPMEREDVPELMDQSVNVNGEINRIAISETLFMKDDTVRWLPGLHSWLDVTDLRRDRRATRRSVRIMPQGAAGY